MRLTRLTEYSYRVLIYLAANRGRQVTIREIAESYSISRNHLMKVANLLARRGFVRAMRGRGGGLTLARAPAEISLGEVVRHLEEDFALVDCFSGDGHCRIEPACRLKPVLARAVDAFLRELDGATLADIVHEPAEIVRLFDRRMHAGPQPTGTA